MPSKLARLSSDCQIWSVLTLDINKLKAGDESEWGIAYPSLWQIAKRAASRYLKQTYPGDVEDIAMVSIRELADKIKQVSNIAHLEMLLAVIARGNALDHLRRMEAERRGGGKIESIEGHDPSAPGDPLSEVDAVELAQLLSELMAKLSERDRKLFQAYHLDGMTQEEIAKHFQMPIGTVGVTLSRALEALEEELERHPKLMKELLELLR